MDLYRIGGFMREPRAIVVVLDSVGCGALPDADAYGDAGANTLAHVASVAGPLHLPNLGSMGLGNVTSIAGVPAVSPRGSWWGRAAERSRGKDTTTGHWEIAGLVSDTAFPTYPEGFPAEVMESFSRVTGLPWLGNVPASGTTILDELAEEHVRTGAPIVYTSADSVFQIACHEDVVLPDRLYELCDMVRSRVCVGPHAVGRIIARPFEGTAGAWRRTHRRRDFALPPTGPTVLDALGAHGIPTLGIGKIGEIFAWKSVASSPHVENNMDAWDKLVATVRSSDPGFVFANLVDFDMLWGHRSDPHGYARGLEAVDGRIPELIDAMQKGDLLIVTADHGCDPTDDSTDHTREYVPLLVTVKGSDTGGALGDRETFADIAATIADHYDVAWDGPGTSFLADVRKG